MKAKKSSGMMPPLPSGRSSAIGLPTSLLLLAAVFRLSGLARDQRLHPDEALYADLSRRVGLWGDWQLLHVPVDKPPLFNFVGGLCYRLLGDSEFATRLPNAFASLILLALLFTLTLRLTHSFLSANLALLLVALSPMEIAMAISGFVDTQLVMWLVLSLVLISYQKWGWSGLALGFGFAVKPMFWLIPLVLGVGITHSPGINSWATTRNILRWLGGILLILLLITLWDMSGEPVGIWQLGGQNSIPKTLIAGDEIIPRAEGWLKWIGYMLPIGGWGLLLLAVRFSIVGARRDAPFGGKQGRLTSRPYKNPLLIIGVYVIGYLLLHWLVKFNIYDRYLLPIVPMIAIEIGGFLSRTPYMMSLQNGTHNVETRYIASAPTWIMLAILLTGLPFAWQAAQGHTPVASDENRHRGIDELAQVMNTRYQGEIFYDHWLGWELRYYLTADPQVILLYFETPEALTEYAQEEFQKIDVPRYLVAPKNKAAQWLAPLERQGIQVELDYENGRFAIYRLTQRLG